jgi:hypothetical protein
MAAVLHPAASGASLRHISTIGMELTNMRKFLVFSILALSGIAAAPLQAQLDGRVSVEPHVGYGFFGSLPGTGAELGGALALGARGSYHLSPQWSVFGNFQRSSPTVTGTLPAGFRVQGGEIDVDHWSAGVEFSYTPRGGAEGMLPVLLEAGLGQARYAGGHSDLAVNLGIASALQLSRNFGIRYGANDYISNYRDGNGVIHQIFVRVGAELTF